ncbi:MAG TPA: M14 family metallopeptidase [Armatimonadota bacterium]|nr:M14 family metallopeptidase [Armatimonadota bacterium]HOM81808.1 M14 family metallopeptidase [Armatimonadota bacterium]HPO74432.1 M14 family metallopeptidase [Armatimonadota bacterium]
MQSRGRDTLRRATGQMLGARVVPTRRTYVAVPLRLRVPALLIGLWLALAAWPASAAYVSRVTATRIEVERLPRHTEPGSFLLAGPETAPRGYLRVVEVKGRRAQCRLVAGTVHPGDETEPIASRPVRLALLTDNPQAPAIAELRTLFPGVAILGPEGRGLDASRFDAAISLLYHPESIPLFRFAAMAAFASAGRPVFMGLSEYASRRGISVSVDRQEAPHRVRCARTHPLLAGLAVGDELHWHGREGSGYVQRRLTAMPEGASPLLVPVGSARGAVAVVEEVGRRGGFIAAFDFISPNGQPGVDPGATWKWLPVGNALHRSIRFARSLAQRQSYDELVERMRDLERRFPGRVALQPLGNDAAGTPIFGLRLGDVSRPAFLIQAGIHGAEWVNTAALLRLAEVLATPQDDPRPRWILAHFSVLLVPVMSPAEYARGAPPGETGRDLECNYDYQWEELAGTLADEWRSALPAERLKGPRPWSEREARILRDLLVNQPVIGYISLHMHGEKRGWRMLFPSTNAAHHTPLLDDLCALVNARLRGRFLRGAEQVWLQPEEWRDEPSSFNWASVRRIPACALETTGTGEQTAITTEVVNEAALGFMEVVAAHALARPQPWAVAGRREIEHPAGRSDLIAFLFGQGSRLRVAYWKHRGVGVLRMLPLPHEAFLRDMKGHVVAFSRTESGLHLPVGEPLLFDPGGAPAEKVVRAFQEASLLPAPRQVIWIPADRARLFGRMQHASRLRLKDPGALADWIVCTGKPDRDRMPSWYAEFAINIPATDTYTIWARLRSPSDQAGAFAIAAPGTQISRDPALLLGNTDGGVTHWHWASQGSEEDTPPGSDRLRLRLTRGRMLLRVYAREAPGTAETNPRLDFLCLTNDPDYTPSDADVPQALRKDQAKRTSLGPPASPSPPARRVPSDGYSRISP